MVNQFWGLRRPHQLLALLLVLPQSCWHRGGRKAPLLAEAAYFYVHEGEEKCFVESVPDKQVLTVRYRHLQNAGVECMLVFKDPRQTQVFSKRVPPEETETGKTSYMTQVGGEHRICVHCTGSKFFQQSALKWELSVDIGDTDSWFQNPAKKGDLRGVERTVLSTLARIEAISAENEYEKATEMEFRDASERMNSHVVVVSIFIMAIEMGLVAWQIFHLRTFFRREKLI